MTDHSNRAPNREQLTFGMASPRPARRYGADTSRAAAARGNERTLTIRAALLAHITTTHRIWTATELWEWMGRANGYELQEIRRRLSDLHKAELIRDSGVRGKTAHGCGEIAWEAGSNCQCAGCERARAKAAR